MSDQFKRVHNGRMIAGVCGGIARQFNVDPLAVRLITVVISLFGFWFTLLAYAALWLILPDDMTGTTGLDDLTKRFGNSSGPNYPGPSDTYRADN